MAHNALLTNSNHDLGPNLNPIPNNETKPPLTAGVSTGGALIACGKPSGQRGAEKVLHHLSRNAWPPLTEKKPEKHCKGSCQEK